MTIEPEISDIVKFRVNERAIPSAGGLISTQTESISMFSENCFSINLNAASVKIIIEVYNILH